MFLSEFAVQNRFHCMIINELHPVLAAIYQYICTYFVYDASDSGTVFKDLIDCGFRKYLTFNSCNLQLMPYITSGNSPVIMIQGTLYVNPLADRGKFLQ